MAAAIVLFLGGARLLADLVRGIAASTAAARSMSVRASIGDVGRTSLTDVCEALVPAADARCESVSKIVPTAPPWRAGPARAAVASLSSPFKPPAHAPAAKGASSRMGGGEPSGDGDPGGDGECGGGVRAGEPSRSSGDAGEGEHTAYLGISSPSSPATLQFAQIAAKGTRNTRRQSSACWT